MVSVSGTIAVFMTEPHHAYFVGVEGLGDSRRTSDT